MIRDVVLYLPPCEDDAVARRRIQRRCGAQRRTASAGVRHAEAALAGSVRARREQDGKQREIVVEEKPRREAATPAERVAQAAVGAAKALVFRVGETRRRRADISEHRA